MSRVLLVRYAPEAVDYSDPALPPGLNAEKVRAGIDLAMQQMGDRGWQAENCLVRPDESAAPEVERQLRAAVYDCVVIAGGIRIPPPPPAVRGNPQRRAQGRPRRRNRLQHAARRQRRSRRTLATASELSLGREQVA